MKKIYILLFVSASLFGSNALTASASNPSDTLREAKYLLSSRNAEAQTGRYKKLDLALAFDASTHSYALTLIAERAINAYLEISDQDENVIYFKQTEIKEGQSRITFVAEDGHQGLFRLSFSEPGALKPAVFIIRDEDVTAVAQTDIIR